MYHCWRWLWGKCTQIITWFLCMKCSLVGPTGAWTCLLISRRRCSWNRSGCQMDKNPTCSCRWSWCCMCGSGLFRFLIRHSCECFQVILRLNRKNCLLFYCYPGLWIWHGCGLGLCVVEPQFRYPDIFINCYPIVVVLRLQVLEVEPSIIPRNLHLKLSLNPWLYDIYIQYIEKSQC